MSSRQTALTLLRLFIAEIERMTDEEVETLVSSMPLGALSGRVARVARTKKPGKRISDEEIRSLASRLTASQSREEARQFLEEATDRVTRTDLERLARLLRVHVNKHDKRQTIADKVVESVI